MKQQEKLRDAQRGIGERIVHLRRHLPEPLSQAELARRAQIDRTYLNTIEKGNRNLTLKAMLQIAHGLGVPVADLFATGHTSSSARQRT